MTMTAAPGTRFVALDFENAANMEASICQIGVVVYADGAVVERHSLLIDPECDFGPFQIKVHGIRPKDVRGAPTFPDIHAFLCGVLGGQVVVAHGDTEKRVLKAAEARYDLPHIKCRWLDSLKVSLKTVVLEEGGHNIRNLMRAFGMKLKSHDASDDAMVSGEVVLRAMSGHGLSLDDLLHGRFPAAPDPSAIGSG